MYRTIHRYIKDNVIINLGKNPERIAKECQKDGIEKWKYRQINFLYKNTIFELRREKNDISLKHFHFYQVWSELQQQTDGKRIAK